MSHVVSGESTGTGMMTKHSASPAGRSLGSSQRTLQVSELLQIILE